MNQTSSDSRGELLRITGEKKRRFEKYFWITNRSRSSRYKLWKMLFIERIEKRIRTL
jgi:hypothetical protein